MQEDDSIDRLFMEEIRDKKRTASGARHNSGKRGSSLRGITGAVRFPSDVLKYSNKQAYKKYIGAGEIVVSNMYADINNIPSIKELKVKDFKAAQSIVRAAKEHHSLNTLAAHWGYKSGSSIYTLLKKYSIPYGENPQKEIPQAVAINKPAVTEEPKQVRVSEIIVSAPESEEEPDFQLKYSKKSALGSEIQERIMNYISILVKDKKYTVTMAIKELAE